MSRRRPSASSQSKLPPNFPPKLKLTYKDEDGKLVRILPTDLNGPEIEAPEHLPLWRPRPYDGDDE